MNGKKIGDRFAIIFTLLLSIMLIVTSASMAVFAEGGNEDPFFLRIYNHPEGGTLSATVIDRTSGSPIEMGLDEDGNQFAGFLSGRVLAITVEAKEAAGYKLKGITYTVTKPDGQKTGGTVSNGGTVNVTMNGNVDVNAEFAEKGGIISWTEPEGGSISVTAGGSAVSSGGFVKAGSVVEVTAKAHDNYILKSLKVNDESGNEYGQGDSGGMRSFTMPDEAVSIKAEFKVNGCHVTFSDAEHGTLKYTRLISGAAIEGHDSYFKKGSVIEVSAAPEDGYRLKQLYVTKDGEDHPVHTGLVSTHKLDADEVHFSAEFEEDDSQGFYSVGISQSGFGGETRIVSIDGQAGGYKARKGQTVVISVTAYSGNEVTRVKVNSFDSGEVDIKQTGEDKTKYEFTMPADHVYISSYIAPLYTPQIKNPGGHGTVMTDKDGYKAGDTVTITAKPDEGYALVPNSLSVIYIRKGLYDGIKPAVSDDGTFSFRMPSAKPTVTMKFAKPYHVNVSSSKGGSVICELNNTYGDYTTAGRTVKLTVQPDKACRLEKLTVKTVSGEVIELDEDLSFKMPSSDVSIDAQFGSVKNNVSSAGVSSAAAGETAALTAASGSGHKAPAAAGTGEDNSGSDVANEDNSIILLDESDTVAEVLWDYDESTGEYEWPENEFCYLYLCENGKGSGTASAVSSDENVAEIAFCGKGYVKYIPKKAGNASITYTGSNGGTIVVPVEVKVSCGIRMLVFNQDDGKREEIHSGEAVFDENTFLIWVEPVGGVFENEVAETGESKILDIDDDGGDLKSTGFYIMPKGELDGPAETVISGTDKAGNKCELTVRVTQEYIDAHDRLFEKVRRLMYLMYFMGLTDLTDDDSVYEMKVPFSDYNVEMSENEMLDDDWRINEEELQKLTGTLTIGGKEIRMSGLKEDPDSKGNYIAVFDLGKSYPGGTKYTLTLEMDDARVSDEYTVKETKGASPCEPVSIKGAKVVLSAEKFTYNGKVRKPEIKTVGGRTLKAGTDFTVKWSNSRSKNVGAYTVTVTGKGKYKGTARAEYKIIPKGTGIKKLYKGKRSVRVRWKKQKTKMSKSRITGYQIQLATDRKFTKNKKTLTVKGYKKTIKKVSKLKGKKKYYVRIRTYKTVSGRKYYSKWSKTKTVKTR